MKLHANTAESSAANPAGSVGPIAAASTGTTADTASAEFFDRKYRDNGDPWNFATDSYEAGRYRSILRALAGQTFVSAFEPGCSVGVLTQMLATVAASVYACDFSATAAASAKRRCAGLPGVTVACAALTGNEPWASFDLVVLSEIGYYFTQPAWLSLVVAMSEALRPGTTVVACHWLGRSPDHILHGDEVHATLNAAPLLEHVHGERHEIGREQSRQEQIGREQRGMQTETGYRIDLWRRR